MPRDRLQKRRSKCTWDRGKKEEGDERGAFIEGCARCRKRRRQPIGDQRRNRCLQAEDEAEPQRKPEFFRRAGASRRFRSKGASFSKRRAAQGFCKKERRQRHGAPEEERRLPGIECRHERHARKAADGARESDHRAEEARHGMRAMAEVTLDDDGENHVEFGNRRGKKHRSRENEGRLRQRPHAGAEKHARK